MSIDINQESRELALAFLAQIEEKKEILDSKNGVKVKLQGSEEYLTIPKEIFALMLNAVAKVAKVAKEETFIELEEVFNMLSLERKEDILKLIEEGVLSKKMIDGKQKVLIQDVEKYKAERMEWRFEMLGKMVQADQEMGLY